MEFEWDDDKRQVNIRKHGIDFEYAVEVFERPYLILRSDKKGEQRFVALGLMGGKEIAVVFTMREGAFRIISARRARTNERKAYREAQSRRDKSL